MMSPGEVVFLDCEEKRRLASRRWTVLEARRGQDLSLPVGEGAHLVTDVQVCGQHLMGQAESVATAVAAKVPVA